MPDSIWTATLAEFRDRMASVEPVPAGVTAVAVSATLALALLSKVIQVTQKHKDFSGDHHQLNTLLNDAHETSRTLAKLADDDVAAFHAYLDCVRSKQPTDAALRRAIEVPLNVARTASFGIGLCQKASGQVHPVVAPDLGIAAGILAGAVRSTLITVNSNLEQLPEDDPYRAKIAAESTQLSI